MRMKRHVRSFVKGFSDGRTEVESEVVPTPTDVMAKATKMLQRVMSLQLAWFLCFSAGGLLGVWTAWKNHHLPANCTIGSSLIQRGVSTAATRCPHHSYVLPGILLAVGIVGLLVTGYVATRLAVKYLGAGAIAFLRQGRQRMGPMGPRTGGQSMGGGFPGAGSTGGVPPNVNARLQPGTPGSPSGPPLR